MPEALMVLPLESSLGYCGAIFAGSFAPFRGQGPLAQLRHPFAGGARSYNP